MAASDAPPPFPATRILDLIAQALEERQNATHVTILVADGDHPDDRRAFRVERPDITRLAHTIRRAVAREEAT